MFEVFNEMHKTFTNWQRHWRLKKWMNERARPGEMYEPTPVEHLANTLSHGVMIIPSIIAGEVLLYIAMNVKTNNSMHNYSNHSTTTKTEIHYEFSARTYISSLIFLFVISTTFHWVSWTRCVQRMVHLTPNKSCCGTELWEFFHMCDRTVIFVFIAGSYTPWMVLADIPSHIDWLRWAIWIYAIIGTAYSYIFLEKYKLLETIIYLVIGLGPAVILSHSLPHHHHHRDSFETLSLGGYFYLCGVLVFKSDGFIPFAHAIWHLLVVFGAVAHFYSVFSYLYLPAMYV